MAVKTRTNYASNETKPWERLGMSYQKYNYQKKKGLLPEVDFASNLSTTIPRGLTEINPASGQVVSQETILRNNTLIDDFLGRCERQNAGIDDGMFITQQMCVAIYQTLRQDNH